MLILIGLFLAIVMPIILGGTMVLAVWAQYSIDKSKLKMEDSKNDNIK